MKRRSFLKALLGMAALPFVGLPSFHVAEMGEPVAVPIYSASGYALMAAEPSTALDCSLETIISEFRLLREYTGSFQSYASGVERLTAWEGASDA